MLGETKFRIDEVVQNKIGFQSNMILNLNNGFGVDLFTVTGIPLFFCGEVPSPVSQEFAQRGQFIFFLEAVAQMLALFAFPSESRGPYLSFIDNTAAQFALTKGFSSDDASNTLSSIFWATAARNRCAPCFERVSSKANIADAVSRHDRGLMLRLGAKESKFCLFARLGLFLGRGQGASICG